MQESMVESNGTSFYACFAVCLVAMSGRLEVEGAGASYAQPIVPAESRNYEFGDRWVNPKRCGKTFWLTFSTPFGKEEMDVLAQFGHDKRFAHYGRPTLERRKRIRGEHRCRDPRVKRVFERVRLGEIPAFSHGPAVQSPDGVTVVPHPLTPSKDEIERIADELGERWLGWIAFNEWGIRVDRMARYFANGAKSDNPLRPCKTCTNTASRRNTPSGGRRSSTTRRVRSSGTSPTRFAARCRIS